MKHLIVLLFLIAVPARAATVIYDVLSPGGDAADSCVCHITGETALFVSPISTVRDNGALPPLYRTCRQTFPAVSLQPVVAVFPLSPVYITCALRITGKPGTPFVQGTVGIPGTPAILAQPAVAAKPAVLAQPAVPDAYDAHGILIGKGHPAIPAQAAVAAKPAIAAQPAVTAIPAIPAIPAVPGTATTVGPDSAPFLLNAPLNPRVVQ